MGPRFILGVTLFILALVQGLKESVAMYNATKYWQPNRYMKLLVEHGILYFSAYVFIFSLSLFGFAAIVFSHPPTCINLYRRNS